MDRNTITGLVLIFAMLIGYSIWMTPSKEEKQAHQRKQDSIAQVKRTQDSLTIVRLIAQQKQDSIVRAMEAENLTGLESGQETPIQTSQIDRDKLGIFSNSSIGEDEIFIVENELMKIKVSARGGKILTTQLKEFQTYDSLPLILFDENKTKFGLTFFANNRIINTNDLYFQAVETYNTNKLSMRLYTDANDASFNKSSYIEFLYDLSGNDYMMGFDINIVGMKDYFDAGTNYIDLSWSAELLKLERSVDRLSGPTIYYKFYQDEVDYLSETKDAEESLTTKVKWVSFKHRFFGSTLIAENYFLNANIKTFNLENQNDRYLRSMETEIGLPLNVSDQNNIPMAFYFGPSRFNVLKKYGLELEEQVPLGWGILGWINQFAVIPVFNYLEGFGWNYGIIILVLTILLKIVLFPIAYKSYISSAKMRVLKPEIDELGKKFPKKDDAMKKQQATMALYKQAGVNPMAGCVPMLLQFPILIALFRFFPSAFELRQKSFLWAHDLSSYDSILDLGFEIPFYGDHVSLFTLLMTVSTIMYTKINQDMMGTAQTQMPGMKTMMYLMPVMFLGMFNNYASGLSYYYFLANIITFAQMFLIRKTINEGKIRKQIEINKKKPAKKKSSWQKRLEDAAKQRGYNAQKKK